MLLLRDVGTSVKGVNVLEQLNLMIADDAEIFRSDLCSYLQDSFSIHCCRDGVEAAEYTKSHHPDIIVLDLMLSKLDGISLLHKIVQSGLHPRVLATTRLDTPYVVETAQRLGVEYLMKKPCDPRVVAERVRDLAQFLMPKTSFADPDVLVSERMLSLGCPPKLRGFAQLQQAIVLAVLDAEAPVTKMIYPTIAGQFKTTPVQVERAIRSVITSAWEHRESDYWLCYFPADKYGQEHRPSNGVFIARIAAEIRRKLDMEKADSEPCSREDAAENSKIPEIF